MVFLFFPRLENPGHGQTFLFLLFFPPPGVLPGVIPVFPHPTVGGLVATPTTGGFVPDCSDV